MQVRGRDTFIFSIGDGHDRIEDSGGSNTIIINDVTSFDVTRGISETVVKYGNNDTITMSNATFDSSSFINQTASSIGLDNLTLMDDVEKGTGDHRDNIISGNAQDNTLDGAGGNDVLIGGDGNDILISYGGHDRLEGGSGQDTYQIGDGWDNAVIADADLDSIVDMSSINALSLQLVTDANGQEQL